MWLVFSEARIGTLTLRNRLIHSATWECMAADDGAVTQPLIDRYVTLAKGEIGLIIPGYMYVHPGGKATPRQTGISDDKHLPGLTTLVDEVHKAGGLIAFQIVHGGRQSPRKVIGRDPLAPSGFGRDPVTLNKPAAATEEEIQEIIHSFVQAARRAKQAGADALQLHCAHGYLLSEFLSPFFNRRSDQWGGAPSNMFRLLKEIIIRIKDEVGRDFPLLVKLNANDFTPARAIGPDLAARYAGWLAELGIAALEVSAGTWYSFHTVRGEIPIDDLAGALSWWMRPIAKMIFNRQIGPCRFQEFYNLPAAEIIKNSLGDVPLTLVGGVRRLAEMDRVVSEKRVDFLSMSRPLIREPFLPKRLKSGETQAAACISCNRCFAAVFKGFPLRCYAGGLPSG
jgi:2,4-dienoyl-CoA reductase-like NADH-dependent reductase (Old Yellow Enzyme family)